MSDAKHTQGPWWVEYSAENGQLLTRILAPDPEGDDEDDSIVIADVDRMADGMEQSTKEADANAWLIVGAPEMYAALKMLLEAVGGFTNRFIVENGLYESISLAHEAVKRAEGRS